uniref:RNA (guanine-9-)-methyltransferase domain-containing protein 1 n=1 Tax=Strongyloides papillosus TaxID=174720 RepID=A0A0N5BKP5_STREA
MLALYRKTISFIKNKFFNKKYELYYNKKDVVWKGVSLQKFSYPSNEFIENCSEEEKQKLQLRISEVETISGYYDYFPTKISDGDWSLLLECTSVKQTLDQIKFIRKKEILKNKDKEKKKVEKSDKMTDDENSALLPKNTLFLSNDIKKQRPQFAAKNYATSLLLNDTPKVVVDCRYIPQLSIRAQNLTMCQLQYIISDNRDRRVPWPICLANFDESLSNKKLMNHLALMDTKNALEERTSKNYTELYDPSKIVYLSPDGEEELDRIEGDEVFVIGGIVDRVVEHNIPRQASLEAAMKDNVKCVKLPLDRYVKWKSGTKYLTLTAVVKILQDVYDSNNDWNYSLRKHIPVRNVRDPSQKINKGKELHSSIREYDRKVLNAVQEKLKSNNLYTQEQRQSC